MIWPRRSSWLMLKDTSGTGGVDKPWWTHWQTCFICNFTKCTWHHHHGGGEHYWLACLSIVWWRPSALDYIPWGQIEAALRACFSIYSIQSTRTLIFEDVMENMKCLLWTVNETSVIRYHTALQYRMKPTGMLQILSKFCSSCYTKCRLFFC